MKDNDGVPLLEEVKVDVELRDGVPVVLLVGDVVAEQDDVADAVADCVRVRDCVAVADNDGVALLERVEVEVALREGVPVELLVAEAVGVLVREALGAAGHDDPQFCAPPDIAADDGVLPSQQDEYPPAIVAAHEQPLMPNMAELPNK